MIIAMINFFVEFWRITALMAPSLLLGFFFAGIMSVLLKPTWVARQLGRSGWSQLWKAALIGVPMPLCSCSVIPVTASIRNAGASKGATAAFLASTPQTGVDSILPSWSLLGPVVTCLKVIAALVGGLLTGWLINKLDPDEQVRGSASPDTLMPSGDLQELTGGLQESNGTCSEMANTARRPEASTSPVKAEKLCLVEGSDIGCAAADEKSAASSCCCEPAVATTPCCSASEAACTTGLGALSLKVLGYGFGKLPSDLGASLLLGLSLSALISLFLPTDLLSGSLASGFGAYALVTLFALPLYVCSTGSIPIALSLIAAGASPGTALVFLIAGPATNMATVVMLRSMLGLRAMSIYLLVLIGSSWFLGAVLDGLSGDALLLPHPNHLHVEVLNWLGHASAALLLLVLLLPKLTAILSRAGAGGAKGLAASRTCCGKDS